MHAWRALALLVPLVATGCAAGDGRRTSGSEDDVSPELREFVRRELAQRLCEDLSGRITNLVLEPERFPLPEPLAPRPAE